MASFGNRPLPFEYLGSEKFEKRRCLFATERCENRETDDQRELMFTRHLFQTPDMIEQHRILAKVADLVDQGLVESTKQRNLGSINAANLIKAHELQESGTAIGKTVLAGFEASDC